MKNTMKPLTLITVRKKIFEIVEVSDNNWSNIYDRFMMCIIIASIIPLAFKGQYLWISIIDSITTSLFIIDYLLRWITADLKKDSLSGLIVYPFTPLAIIDILSILPSLTILNNSLKLLKIFRLLRSFKMFRIFKLARYSKSINIVLAVFKNQKETLITIGGIALSYILISALVIINVEPDTFPSYFDAVYWAIVSLTTVGYGDIYPVTVIGKIITMLSSILGIAIVALPAGIITAGMMEEINKSKSSFKDM